MKNKLGFIARNANWEKIDLRKVKKRKPTDPLDMRDNQLFVYENYINEKLMIVRQPPGAGKSALIKFIFATILKAEPNSKIVIAIPQNIIASGFWRDTLNYPDRDQIIWEIDPLNDLSNNCNDSKVKKLISFLQKDEFTKGIGQRIMICSHAALCRANDIMAKLPVKNISYVIDEAHHVMVNENTDIDITLSNQLGNVVSSILDRKVKTTRLWFTTATYFRGDGYKIISERYENQFESYFLPLDEYFETLDYIETYSYGFIPYKGDFPDKEIQTLLKIKKNRKKTIIYVPAMGRLWAGSCKKTTINRLKKVIHEVWADANILELVTISGRDKRKKQLMDNKHNSDIDIVIAVNLLDEGTDWPEAQQVYDLAPSASLRVANQRFGRLLRDRPSKQHISYFTFFPFVVDFNNKEESRIQLSKNFAAISASFMIEESLVPIKLPSAPREKKNRDRGESSVRVNYFQEVVPDENDRNEIKQEVIESLVRLRSQNGDGNTTVDDYKDCIREVLAMNEITNKAEEIANEIFAELARRFVPAFDTDIEWIVEKGYDKITWETIADGLTNLLMGESGKCSKMVLRELRAYYDGQCKSPEEWVKIAEELALANHEGRLEEYEIA